MRDAIGHTPLTRRAVALSAWCVAPLVALVLIAGCVTTGPGGKQSFMLFSSSQEVEIGAGVNQEILEQEKLLADTVWQNYISELGGKVVSVCDRTDIEYNFAVIDSDQINAFALPGGYIYFYTGLLRLMEDEAQLMSVVAHEVSHVVARHGMKRLQSALIAQLGYEVVFGRSGDSQVRDAAIAIGLTMVFSDYSRDAEREADEFGVHYMVKAGYDPNGALDMFQHLAAAGERNPNVFEKMLSSHPETQERIANVERQIANMGPLSPGLVRNQERYTRMKSRLPAPPSDSAGG